MCMHPSQVSAGEAARGVTAAVTNLLHHCAAPVLLEGAFCLGGDTVYSVSHL